MSTTARSAQPPGPRPRARPLPGRRALLGGLLTGAGACLVAAAALRPGMGGAGAGRGILAMACGASGLILLVARRPHAHALMIALGAALLVAVIAIVGAALTLGAALAWGTLSLVLLGVLAGMREDHQPALLLPACLALAGLGLGLALVEIRLASVGPLAYACAAVGGALGWVCLVGPRRPAGEREAATGRAGILLCGALGAWAALTVDPWQARPPSERFIISYLVSRQAMGERFDQEAFLRAFDRDEAEHALVVGAGARALHLFIARTHGGLDGRILDPLGAAVAARRLSLCIHPVAGRDLEADAAWVADLQRRPEGWAQWLGDPAALSAPGGRAAATAASRAALAGTVRAQARFGVTAATSWVLSDAGASPHLLSPTALMTELQPAR